MTAIQMGIRAWYMSEYDDPLGEEIDETVTFLDLFEALDHYRDVYEVLGVGDSIIRERCFWKLSEIMECDYDYIYDQWLMSA